MARTNRRDVLAAVEIQVVHCINRCVRRAYRCWQDPLTGTDYEHRRELIRQRLEFLAGIMGIEVLAKVANKQDQCSGRIWEGRFKANVLTEESAIAACMVYVDLSPVRAGLAATPEQSDFTSAHEGIADLKSADAVIHSGRQRCADRTRRESRLAGSDRT